MSPWRCTIRWDGRLTTIVAGLRLAYRVAWCLEETSCIERLATLWFGWGCLHHLRCAGQSLFSFRRFHDFDDTLLLVYDIQLLEIKFKCIFWLHTGQRRQSGHRIGLHASIDNRCLTERLLRLKTNRVKLLLLRWLDDHLRYYACCYIISLVKLLQPGCKHFRTSIARWWYGYPDLGSIAYLRCLLYPNLRTGLLGNFQVF